MAKVVNRLREKQALRAKGLETEVTDSVELVSVKSRDKDKRKSSGFNHWGCLWPHWPKQIQATVGKITREQK